MPRKPNPLARPYKVTPEALRQRKQAAEDRWAALQALGPEFCTLPGRPRKKRGPVRDSRGRFVAAK